ncbi:MAG: hypothetical protein ABSC62_10500 [Terracidiphilus sp.]|jgi:hypothetical protein
MKVRELLQHEIWSKETSRKILVGFAVFVAALFIVFGTWYEFETHWLTIRERVAAKVALQRIDALQNADSLSDEEFKIRRNEVNSAVDAAGLAARTSKDEMVAAELIMCFMGTESARMDMMKQRWIQEGKLHQSANDRESDYQIELFTDTVARQSCLKLHKELK